MKCCSKSKPSAWTWTDGCCCWGSILMEYFDRPSEATHWRGFGTLSPLCLQNLSMCLNQIQIFMLTKIILCPHNCPSKTKTKLAANSPSFLMFSKKYIQITVIFCPRGLLAILGLFTLMFRMYILTWHNFISEFCLDLWPHLYFYCLGPVSASETWPSLLLRLREA